MSRLLNALPFAAAALLFAAPAFAQPDAAGATDAPSVVVRFDDLTLDNPVSAHELEHRIDRAASVVCGGQPDIRDLSRLADFERCRADADHRAVRDLRVAGILIPAHGGGISPLARR